MSRLKDKIHLNLEGFHGHWETTAELEYFYSDNKNVCMYISEVCKYVVHFECGDTMDEAITKMHKWCCQNKINGATVYTREDIKKFKIN